MAETKVNHLILDQVLSTVRSAFEAFIFDRQARNLTKSTIQYYRDELGYFLDFLQTQEVERIEDLSPDHIRSYLLYLREVRNRNQGGIHSMYRSIRAFLNFTWDEFELDIPNPIKKVTPPKLIREIKPGVTLDVVDKLLEKKRYLKGA